jgi:hypothetical protein
MQINIKQPRGIISAYHLRFVTIDVSNLLFKTIEFSTLCSFPLKV